MPEAPQRSSLLLLTDRGLVRVAEGPGRWTTTSLRAGENFQCLAIDPQDDRTIYLGTRGDGVWKTANAGATWRRLPLEERDVFALAVSPADGCVYVGCEPSRLYGSRDGGAGWRELEALRDLPSAPTWSFPPRPWTSHVSAIAPHPDDPQLLLVGIELGGLMRSDDGGRTWQDHRPGAQRDVHAIAWHPRDGDRAYEAGGGGAAATRDRGRTWSPADDGRSRSYCWALAVDPTEPDTWFVSASPGARHAHGDRAAEAGLYRRRGDAPWEAIHPDAQRPLEDMPYALAVGDGRLFAGMRSGRLLVSSNQGDTWDDVRLDAPLRGLRVLVATPATAA